MTRKQKRKIAVIVTLLLLLALLGWYYMYYQATNRLDLKLTAVSGEIVEPPQYLFAFNGGAGGQRMQRPVGVMVDGNDVFVVDSARHVVDVFNLDGDYQRSFGASETIVPLYIAKNPLDNNLYVTDRRDRSVHIFSPQGEYLKEFDPRLPAEELPTFETQGVQWAPVALAFAPDGSLYVTEILNGHRLMIFGPDGAFRRSVGTVGIVNDAEQGQELFQFPNGVAIHDDLVYVTDSNNRRIQVFDKSGSFKRIIVTQGLPRGISFLSPFPSDESTDSARFVVADTLAHDGTLWSTKGTKILSFGQQGQLEGEFSYPNDVSVGARNKMFITDTANGRVQVWGWTDQVSPVPVPRVPDNWGWCLLPLALLPLLFLLRKKRFFTTPDFVYSMVGHEQADLMPARDRRWFVTIDDYAQLRDVRQGDVDMGQLLREIEHSESDVRALMDKLEIPEDQAIVLSLAQRSRIFATEDLELRRLAKILEVDVVNRAEFLERFTKRDSDGTSGTDVGTTGDGPEENS